MSSRKASKLSNQRAQTVMPRPPYSAYPTTPGTVHRRIMLYQAKCSGVRLG